jgi:hypothetical protein
MATLLQTFPGAANRTRCFTHILNLVAKCTMKQFDAPKKKKGTDGDDFDDNDDDAADLQVALDALEDELEDDRVDKDGSWEYNIRIELTDEEVEELEETVQPVRRVLAKVS